jgi:hypothetical protein
MAIRRTGLSWAVWGSGKLHLAAKLVQKKRLFPEILSCPIAEGANDAADRALSAMRLYARYGGLLLSLTRPHFQNNASVLEISIQNQLKTRSQTG